MVTGPGFHVASSKIVTSVVGPLLVPDSQAGELLGFYSALEIGVVKILFVSDVQQCGIESCHRVPA